MLDKLKIYNDEADETLSELENAQLKLKQIQTQITFIKGNRQDFDSAI